ncbi:ABC transporter permease [Acetivibrio mesophilus]|uniref:ABC transporter permease n=1 Tax=Acetivibrio mesophilus TaxID=2487273 RepID=A0A4V1K2K3_9FIRM|nr:ABC transporter permease [Acetivibrio mesophilus]ODM26351.1 ABC transporter [Clostridium sp. Bc-iso-3]RXE60589.1 ABC transporter permease [Acetivibrio mesophilus]HHV30355.1 ABC transporter permease [Clostridium sp.]
MKGFIGLTKRHLLLYFKDIQSVVFSLLTSIIVFVLYLLFLKGTFVDAINSVMNGLESIINSKDIEMLVNGILLTGIMGSAMITVPYNCLTTVVKDRENKIDYDISATPMKRWQIILSYFVSSVISAFVMTAIIFTIGLITLNAMGDTCLSVKTIIKLYGVIILGAISATAFFMIIVLFFKSSSACAAFFGMLSAATGFVIGAYIPVSQFSDSVQTACNIFPASHITVLFRNTLLSGVLEKINNDIGGLDQGKFAESIQDIFSFQAYMFGEHLKTNMSVIYTCVFASITIIVMTLLYAKTYKRR